MIQWQSPAPHEKSSFRSAEFLMSLVLRSFALVCFVFAAVLESSFALAADSTAPVEASKAHSERKIELSLRTRAGGKVSERSETLDPRKAGVVAIDVWNHHWCKTASARVGALVPRMNATLAGARKLGMQVFLCPTDAADKYVGTLPHERAAVWPRRKVPWGPEVSCPPVPGYGAGCMCGNSSCKGNYGWDGMHPDLVISDDDLMPNDAECLYSICQDNGITHLIVVGVHTQICVLGKPTGIRNMKRAGMECILARDLTDALTGYDPANKLIPDTSTANIVAHFEEHLAPTINFFECMAEAGVADRNAIVDPIRMTPWGMTDRPHFFEKEQVVTITAPWQEGAEIRYTLDGSEPTMESKLYVEPLVLKETARVRAAGFRDDRPVASCTDCYFVRLPPMPPKPNVPLNELKPDWAAGPGHGHYSSRRDEYRYEREARPPQINQSNFGTPLLIRGTQYEKGLGVRAPSQMIYPLKPEYDRFVALAGIDDHLLKSEHGTNLARLPSVVFKVFIDGKLSAESPRMRISEGPWRFDVPIPAGSRQISLATTDAGDGNREDVADWVDAGFVLRSKSASEANIDFNRDIRPILADNCLHCHGPDNDQRQAGLRLDVRENAIKAAESGEIAIVPSDASKSELVRRIMSTDAGERMPPADSHKSLTAQQRALLTRWINEGAEYQAHWAYIAPVRPKVPSMRPERCRVHNDIDVFVADRLTREGLEMSREADKTALLRRLSFALTGLPPTLEEVEQFLADTSPEAYEKQVDRLLASPHYGERMALIWLDLARYADSDGYHDDTPRVIYQFRDYVINSFNTNKPFDQFTIEQLAGDLLPDASLEQKIASAFHRLGPTSSEVGADAKEYLAKYAVDRVNTTATVWLGLTLNCTECHDHKYDPFTTKEYYSLFAFFNQVPEQALYRGSNAPPSIRTPSAEQQKKLDQFELQLAELTEHITRETQTGGASDAESLRARETALRKRRDELLKSIPEIRVMADIPDRRPTHILVRGDYRTLGEEVQPAVPAQLGSLPSDKPATRLSFAKWLVAPEHPLTARVTVNRFWQAVFGRGLVRTSEDFGSRGEMPSHPELLDWLACEFVEKGWDTKHLTKLMVMSATFRQSSVTNSELRARDPDNRLLARGPRFRLPAEMVRDNALAISGLLNRQVGGPSVMPYQPGDLWREFGYGDDATKTYNQDHGGNLYRRGLYTFWKRSVLHPALMAFDAPNREVCTAKRSTTNTPLQALVTLNDTTFFEAARVFAERIMNAEDKPAERLQLAFRLALARSPTSKESAAMLSLYQDTAAQFRKDPHAAKKLVAVGESPRAKLDPVEHAAWSCVCNAILNFDETLTKQ